MLKQGAAIDLDLAQVVAGKIKIEGETPHEGAPGAGEASGTPRLDVSFPAINT